MVTGRARTLNPELGSDKAIQGRAGSAGRQSVGLAAPSLRSAEPNFVNGEGPGGAGRAGRGGSRRPMGTWSARPEPPGLGGPGQGAGAGATKRSPRQPQNGAESNIQRQRPRQTQEKERETR